MNHIAMADICCIIGLICLVGSIATLLSLLFKSIFKRKVAFLGRNQFVLFCFFFSGAIICGSILLCITTWEQICTDIFAANVFFYIVLTVVTFIIVFYKKYLFIVTGVLYALYVGMAFTVLQTECMQADASFSVVVKKNSDEASAGVIGIKYIEVSSYLLLPFPHTWITQIQATDVSGIQFKKGTSVGLFGLYSDFLFAHAKQKTLQVKVPLPQNPPVPWEVSLSLQGGTIRANLKRLL